MARPQRCRRICGMPAHTKFTPEAENCREAVSLSLDEYETIRLMDREGLTHEQCAGVMQISRTTVTEIYAAARRKIAEAIVSGRALVIGGGRVKLCDHRGECGYGVCIDLPDADDAPDCLSVSTDDAIATKRSSTDHA